MRECTIWLSQLGVFLSIEIQDCSSVTLLFSVGKCMHGHLVECISSNLAK